MARRDQASNGHGREERSPTLTRIPTLDGKRKMVCENKRTPAAEKGIVGTTTQRQKGH